MIEILEGFPDNVVAVSASGRVTRQDYEGVLIPKVTAAFDRHRKIRVYYQIGAFTGMDLGAAWEDFRLGIEHLAQWERVAVVTDVDWIRLAVNMFRFLMPGTVRVFGADQAADARVWIAAP